MVACTSLLSSHQHHQHQHQQHTSSCNSPRYICLNMLFVLYSYVQQTQDFLTPLEQFPFDDTIALPFDDIELAFDDPVAVADLVDLCIKLEHYWKKINVNHTFHYGVSGCDAYSYVKVKINYGKSSTSTYPTSSLPQHYHPLYSPQFPLHKPTYRYISFSPSSHSILLLQTYTFLQFLRGNECLHCSKCTQNATPNTQRYKNE
jgi:hypothetical protein